MDNGVGYHLDIHKEAGGMMLWLKKQTIERTQNRPAGKRVVRSYLPCIWEGRSCDFDISASPFDSPRVDFDPSEAMTA